MDTRLNGLRTVCALAALAGLAACGGSSGSGSRGNNGGIGGGTVRTLVATPKTALTLAQAPSCNAFKDYVAESMADLVLNVGMLRCPGCDLELATGVAVDRAAPAGSGAAAFVSMADALEFSDFTGTNNQEAGVDELDQIETDASGNFYLIDGDHLVIANGLPPANLREIASLEIAPDRQAEGILLDPDNGRLVVVLSQTYDYTVNTAQFVAPIRWDPVTELLFVDVSDPSNPVVDRRLKIDGFRMAVRRIGDRVHLVSHATPTIPLPIADDADLLDLIDRYREARTDGDDSGADEIADEIRAHVATLVATTEVSEFLPALMADAGTQAYVDITAGDCTDVAVPDVSLALALTSVTSVDSDGTDIDSLTFVNSSWNVYASTDHIYLSQLSSGWWWNDRQQQQTAIYKIGIGPGSPRYLGTGLVDGWAGSSFQFSEHDGYLRVATNRSELDPAEGWRQDNNLYVLGDDGAGSLEVIGSVTGFGADERIFSARFLGDRAFVVTFRQIDPLFAFDLSIPQDPRLVGEIEIPGVSTYIHPLDETHLLTIGFDGDDNRLNGDFQLQIFDVQNLDDPRLVHKYVPDFGAAGFAWTPATYDHLAFNYFPAAGTLTVPLQYYADDLEDHFSGFSAYSVSTVDGFADLGRLDHSDLARDAYCDDGTGNVPTACADGFYLEAANPRRSVSTVFQGETFIYTLSNVGMKVSNAADFGDAVAVLPLPYRNEYPWAIAY